MFPVVLALCFILKLFRCSEHCATKLNLQNVFHEKHAACEKKNLTLHFTMISKLPITIQYIAALLSDVKTQNRDQR